MDKSIVDFRTFCEKLLECGFSTGGANAQGVYAIVDFSWENPRDDTVVRWHTGDPETDPWEWRMRVLEERNDIAYAKLFHRASGFITREFYPYFLKFRRRGRSFGEAYADGIMSSASKKLYETVARCGVLATHEMASECGFPKADKTALANACAELQTGMYITMCGRKRRLDINGEPYGWNSAVFCTVEEFWGGDIASELSEDECFDIIKQQILGLNPGATEKAINAFIRG